MAAMYRYDPLDRLMSCMSDTQASAQRFYCANKLVTEIQGAASYSLLQYDKNIMAQLRQQGPQRKNILLANDPQGSVTQAITETQFNTMTYTLYGYQPDHSGLTSLLGFNGERCESLTGHYLLGNGLRAFNPVLMRFNSPDPTSPFEGGGINAYAYCKNDPINWSDPSGNIPIKLIASLAPKIPRVSTTVTAARRAQKALSGTQHKYKNQLKYQLKKKSAYDLAVAAEERGEFTGRVSVYNTPSSTAVIDEAYRIAQETYKFKIKPSPDITPSFFPGPPGSPSAVDTSAFDATNLYFKNKKHELLKIPSHKRSEIESLELNNAGQQLFANKRNRLIHIHKSLNNSIRNS